MVKFLKSVKGKIIIAASVLAVAVAVLLVFLLNAGGGYRNISIAEIYGNVLAENNGNEYQAYKNMRLADGYVLTTDADSYTRMLLDDDKYVKLEQDSRACFERVGKDSSRRTGIRLERGALTAEITKPLSEDEDFVVNTPNAVLAVRGTYFRVEVKFAKNGDAYCDVYTYGGEVVCRRVMPDGTVVDEEVSIKAGYKATIRMDEIITEYVEERIEEGSDNVDPIDIGDISDDELVALYSSSIHGHELFLNSDELWELISERDIDISEYRSVYDNGEIPVPSDADRNSEPLDVNSNGDNISTSSEEFPENGSDKPHEPNRPNNAGNVGISDGHGSDISDGNGTENDSAPSEPITPDDNSSQPQESVSQPNEDISQSDDSDTEQGGTGNRPIDNSVSEEDSAEIGGNTETEESTRSNESADTEEVFEPDETVQTSESEMTDETESSETTSEIEQTNEESSEQPESEQESDNDSSGSNYIGGSGGGHVHTKVTTTDPATCTEDGRTIVSCSVCGKVISSEVIPAKGHSEETVTTPSTCTEKGYVTVFCKVCDKIISSDELGLAEHTLTEITDPATCTEDGRKTVSCSVCGEVISSEEIPAKGHTEETEITPSTCTEKGYVTVFCKVCDKIISRNEIAALGHTESVEIIEPTVSEEGKRRVVCSACGEVIEETVLPKWALYTEDGSITITETGYTQGDAENETAYTGDYVIKQRDSETAVDCSITVESGEHNIVLDGVNIAGTSDIFTVAENAVVELCGGKANYFDKGDGGSVTVRGIVNQGSMVLADGLFVFGNNSNANKLTYAIETYGEGTFVVSGGKYYAASNMTWSFKTNRQFMIQGGSISLERPFYTGRDGVLTISGGSINASVNGKNTPINPAGDELECVVFDEFPSIDLLTYTSSDGNIYTYKLSESDIDDDGKYYVWLPTTAPEGIAIDSENFPDSVFRQYISDNFDTDGNGVLSDEELAAVEEIDVSGTDSEDGGVTSLEGIEYFTGLTCLKCEFNSALTSLDVSSNTDLTDLYCSNTGITSLDVSNNTALTYLSCNSTGIASLDVRSNTALTSLYCSNTGISNLDVGNNTALMRLSCGNTSITSLEISNNTDLTALYCSDTGISSLDVSNNTALAILDCNHTSISSLDVRNNAALVILNCSYTDITSIDVSNNTALVSLVCAHTGVTSLDVSNNTALTELDCGSTNIPFVNLDYNHNLTTFVCSDCKYVIPANFIAFSCEEISGLDPTRISDVTNANFDSMWAFTDITGDVTYTYDCGQGFYGSFTLSRTGEEMESECVLYTEDGSITITESGFEQGRGTQGISYTGDYVISQKDNSDVVDCVINVKSGTHSITLSGVNTDASADDALIIGEGAIVTLKGTQSNALYAGGRTVLTNNGTLTIESGKYICQSDDYSIDNLGCLTVNNADITCSSLANENIMNVNGGRITIEPLLETGLWNDGTFTLNGGVIDVKQSPTGYELNNYSGFVIIKGGTFKLEQQTIIGSGKITNGVDELECLYYDEFPDESERTFTNSDGTSYVYALTEEECADDGKFYIWKPIVAYGEIPIYVTNFPDEVFRNYVRTNFDSDGNGYLSETEIAAATEITVSGEESLDGGVTSLKGIEFFTELTGLQCRYNSGLTSLDVSNNTALILLDCSLTCIASLDISSNTALEALYCFRTKIKSLDVRNNTALTYLYCYGTGITSLDVSDNTALIRLFCENTGITSLDVRNNTRLEELDCSLNNIINLDVSNNTALTELYCYSTNITSLDVSNNTALWYLDCSDTNITSLDVSNKTYLTKLWCQNTNITSLDVSDNTRLLELDCSGTNLLCLDISGNTALSQYNCSGCKYVIPADSTSFDPYSIPGFDATKVSEVTNADFNSSTGMFTNIIGDVTYTYDCGQGYSETFTLTRTG